MLKNLLDGIRAFVGSQPLPGEEVRDRARVLCRYPVDCRVLDSDLQFQAHVVDVSRSGMRLESVGEVRRADRLQIALQEQKGLGAAEVEVMWARERSHDGARLAGVRYLDPAQAGTSWVQRVLEEVGLSVVGEEPQRRKHIRLATSMRAELRHPSSGELLGQGKVSNLSVGGTMVVSDRPLPADTQVQVLLAPYPAGIPIFGVAGRVVAASGEQLSLQFVQVSPRQLKTLKRFLFTLLKERSL